MTTDVRIRRQDGGIQFSSKTLTAQLRGKGTVTVQTRVAGSGNSNPGSGLVPLPYQSAPYIIATRSSFYVARSGSTTISGQSYAVFATAQGPGATFDYWLFDMASNFPPAHVGMNLRDISGLVTYTSGVDSMIIGQPIYGAPASTPLPAGRVYAAAVQNFAGRRRHPEAGVYYINGTPSFWDGSPRSPTTRWAYANDGKLYGTRFGADGSLQTGTVSWDDVIAQLNTGSTPREFPPDWDAPLGTILAIDVTNL